MYRIGILGSENSHAMAFSQIFNGYSAAYAGNLNGEFEDITVVGTFGTDNTANQSLLEKAGVSFIADKPEDFLGRVDAVMITARDGKFHAEYALPFIKAGIPAFIDKPFTRDSGEALALARLAKEKNVPLCGGSSLKICQETLRLADFAHKNKDAIISGSVYAPVNLHNEYGDFWFYSSHLAEISLSVFGYHPIWTTANMTERGVTALVHYKDFDISNHFSENMYSYAGTVVTPNGIHMQTIGLDTMYAEECRLFARMLRTGVMPHTYEALIAPVYYLESMERAVKTGNRERFEQVVL